MLISQPVRGGQFSDTPEHGSWFRNEAMPKVRNDRFCVRISQLRYRCENGLDLRRKYQPTSLLSIEEGFLAKPIAPQEQTLGSLSPHRYPKHAAQRRQAVSAFFFIQVRDYFRV